MHILKRRYNPTGEISAVGTIVDPGIANILNKDPNTDYWTEEYVEATAPFRELDEQTKLMMMGFLMAYNQPWMIANAYLDSLSVEDLALYPTPKNDFEVLGMLIDAVRANSNNPYNPKMLELAMEKIHEIKGDTKREDGDRGATSLHDRALLCIPGDAGSSVPGQGSE